MEVNSGVVIYRDVKRRGITLVLCTDSKGDSCFSIYQISWIKMTKITFFKLKSHFVGTFLQCTNFRGSCQVIFTTFVANSA